jgi:hypothetical protein
VISDFSFLKRTIPLFFFLAACRPPAPTLIPPADVHGIRGLASLKISREGRTARSKFSFAISLPDRGRIDVVDPLGRTALQFFVEGEEAYLVLPSKRAYGCGGRGEVLEKFLGFPLDLDELAGLLAGRWGRGEGTFPQGWAFERDGRGRMSAGRREDFSFVVLEFFPGDGVPRRFSFRGGASEGTVTLLQAAFNGPAILPALGFRERCRLLSWEEIERLLRDEG